MHLCHLPALPQILTTEVTSRVHLHTGLSIELKAWLLFVAGTSCFASEVMAVHMEWHRFHELNTKRSMPSRQHAYARSGRPSSGGYPAFTV